MLTTNTQQQHELTVLHAHKKRAGEKVSQAYSDVYKAHTYFIHIHNLKHWIIGLLYRLIFSVTRLCGAVVQTSLFFLIEGMGAKTIRCSNYRLNNTLSSYQALFLRDCECWVVKRMMNGIHVRAKKK